ncbi:MAG: alpha/beta fold hydrolase [Gemmatimonadales bacterium]
MQTIDSGGARISYERTGSGPAVLLIQGVGQEGRAWGPQVEALRPWFTVTHFDHRGVGRSSKPDASLSIEQMAEDALAVMDAEGIEDFHVVGHSMGGVVAQQLALVAPRRVLSLSLLCTFSRGRDALRLDGWMVWAGIRSRIGTRRSRGAAFLEMLVPTEGLAPADTVEIQARLTSVFGRDLADQPPVAMRQLQALARYDASDRLASLRYIPTLVVSGELDRIARPSSGRALAAAIPGARYVEVPGAGHALPAYHPDVINKGLLDHLLAAEEISSAVMSWV